MSRKVPHEYLCFQTPGSVDMADLSFLQPGLVLQRGGEMTSQQVRDLQRSLRALGYLRGGIDGDFGSDTELAVRSLQIDLLVNDGTSCGGDGAAPIGVLDFNRGRVPAVTGIVDQGLARCIADMLDDPANVPTLPFAQDPKAENRKVGPTIGALPGQSVPVPFLIAILRQESGLRHYREPGTGDEDSYLVVGLDRNDPARPERITSRGYGVGQYTLFHHPPNPSEVATLMLDVAKNVQQAIAGLRRKLDHFVAGPNADTTADDRIAEHGRGPLRLCKYPVGDDRYLRDCRECAFAAGTENITPGVTPLYPGADQTYHATQYYPDAQYRNVPIRRNLPCDWAYAARRYNGSGMNSYHYQLRILLNLLE